MSKINSLILALLFLAAGVLTVRAQNVIQISTPKVEDTETGAGKPARRSVSTSPVPAKRAETVSPSSPSTAALNPDADIDTGLKVPVSLDLRDMDIMETIKFLATKGGLNMVATKSVSGRVTLFLNNVTIGDVLDIIVLTNSLACERKKNIITIMTDAEYQALYGKPYVDKREAKTIALKYADPTSVVEILSNIKSDIGKIVVNTATATLILIDVPAKIKEMEEAIAGADIPTVNRVLPTITEVFELSYAEVKDIEPEITKSLTENIGAIRLDERTNTMVVTDLPHSMEIIKKVIKAFDAKTKQVLIKAKIVELTLSDDYYQGVDWERIVYNLGDMSIAGTFPFGGTGNSSMVVTMGTIAENKYDSMASFLQTLGDIKVISSPHIAVCDKEEASFMVGTREAYVTSTTTSGEVTTSVSENVEFIDVGVTLKVTPTINKDGFIKMEFAPEISSVSDTFDTSEGNEIPIVSTSNLETTILVKDGTTIMIAGLVKDTAEKTKNKMPLWGDIPIVSQAFHNREDELEDREVLVFLTPYIISGEEDILDTRLSKGKKKKL